MKRLAIVGAASAVFLGLLSTAAAQAPATRPGSAPEEGPGAVSPGAGGPGEALFKARCATCHDPAVDRAPDRKSLAGYFGDDVFDSMKKGVMQPMAEGLSDDQMAAIALYVTGRAPKILPDLPTADSNQCATNPRFNGAAGQSWNGWSPDLANTRMQANGGLKAADLPRLKVKWAFTYMGGRYGQPTVVGGRVFAASSSGRVYSLDAKTGCVHWRFDAPYGVRTTLSVGRNAKAPSGWAAYFGDFHANVYAVDAQSGKELWKTVVETHPRTVLSGAPILYKDRLYVPVSSWEETISTIAAYECCTFRGSVVALDTKTGKQAWKTYVIEQAPKPQARKNDAGTQMYGPAGAAIWSAPTIDVKRNAIYVATGDSYTDVKEDASDAIVAMDLTSGKIRWKNQVTAEDNFLTGCGPTRRAINCPLKVGPDWDYGASPIIKTMPNGKDVVLSGQKSGVAYAMDPDTGATLWSLKVGVGGALGGIEWGIAADDRNVYAPVADMNNPNGKQGIYAIDMVSGQLAWSQPAPKSQCSWEGRCNNAMSAPPTLVPGAVLIGSTDGHLRAYATEDGKQVWDFNTAGQTYKTVNGYDAQPGGALDGTGPTIAGGMMFMMSGYNGSAGGGRPDNVLLAFSIDGK